MSQLLIASPFLPSLGCANGMLATDPGTSLGIGVALVVLLLGPGWFLLRQFGNP
jgi:hypothetical protein